jgi:hypothetical protein
VKKEFSCNRVLAVLQGAQFQSRGEFPVKVTVAGKEYVVSAARFNANSGNVELSVKE